MPKGKIYDPSDADIPVRPHDLRALIHWACFGVAHAVTGSYQDIEQIVPKYNKACGYQGKIEWGKYEIKG
jgi:hypothetical protein